MDRLTVRKLDRLIVLVGILTLAALALRFWRLGDMPLFADEAYYLLWADRLAPAYFDHPAGIALLLRLSTALGGGSEWGVRWLNALLSAACVPLAYAAGQRYVNKPGGLIAAAAMALAPIYVVTGRVAYPDALQCFLLLVNLLALAPLLAGRIGPWRWAWFSLTLALLLNVKLSSAFYGAGLVIYVLGWRRDLLRQPGSWLAGGIAVAGALPLLGWNAAHDWAGVRWALYQGQGFGFAPAGLIARLAHAGSYHTAPAVLLAALAAAVFLANLAQATHQAATSAPNDRTPGLAPVTQQADRSPKGRLRTKLRRPHRPPDAEACLGSPQAATSAPTLLALVAACMLAPVLFSAADNPRNLGLGLAPLWPLAGIALAGRNRRLWTVAVSVLLAWLAAFGAGSAAALLGPTPLPHSRSASVIRADAAGWPAFAEGFTPQEDSLIFTVDYSIAGQVSYYTGRPVYSASGQFRIWGIPEADSLTVLSQAYIPAEIITERLRADFAEVTGPQSRQLEGGEARKEVFIWEARGRKVTMERIVEDLDYIALAQAARRPLR